MSVKVRDVEMQFWSMVIFMIKFSIAALPAFIFLFVVGSLVSVMFLGGAGALFGRH